MNTDIHSKRLSFCISVQYTNATQARFNKLGLCQGPRCLLRWCLPLACCVHTDLAVSGALFSRSHAAEKCRQWTLLSSRCFSARRPPNSKAFGLNSPRQAKPEQKTAASSPMQTSTYTHPPTPTIPSHICPSRGGAGMAGLGQRFSLQG